MMPILHSWQCVYPDYWTTPQLADYLRHCTAITAFGMAPVVQIGSPLAAVNVLLTVVAKIAQENPVWRGGILDSMAEVVEKIAELPLGKKETMQ